MTHDTPTGDIGTFVVHDHVKYKPRHLRKQAQSLA
jgi:hypothetical protein